MTIVGAMGLLMGGSEKFFSLRTESGKEYTCLAQPKLTKGYGAIASGKMPASARQKTLGK
ncbi:MAG: hypothetical protein HC856_02560 [Pseudanabaena sp. RU_4_16]|nr:hypothetical protein [Pseudanabaena sp. RU_4_16]